jgi:RimJ/RimL family protein N-acetyltransferase
VVEGPPPSARLTFRPWRRADALTILDMYSRPEVYRYLGASPQPVRDLQEARARITSWGERADGFCGIWAVEVAGAPVGTALLVPLPRSDGAPTTAYEIGWHLHPDAWGHGYATEAGEALLGWARQAGLREVRAVVYPDNERSRSVCRRLGMTEVGLTGEWYGVDVVEYRSDL